MKIPKTYFGEYSKKSVLYISKSKILFLVISLIEFIEVFVCLLDYQDFFFLLDQNYYATQTQLAKLLLSIIPFSYYFDYFISKNSSGFDVAYIALLIYAFLVILFFVYLIIGKNGSNEEILKNNMLTNILNKVSINFFDLFLFRLAALYGINTIVCAIFKILQINNYNVAEVVALFLLFFFLICVAFLHYYYFLNVCIWSNFKIIDTCLNRYPYEIFYSKKYDIVMFTLKLIIVIVKNYLHYNNNIGNFLVIFLTLLLEIIFFGFIFYTINLLFFSKNVLYLYLNFYNKIRILFLLFMVEALILRFGFHVNGDYIPYFTFIIIFLIFNLYIILSVLDSYAISSLVNSQNYVGICWFFQGNNMNMQKVTLEWISNHRENCILDVEQCPICSKLIVDFDIYKEECLQLLKDENDKKNINKISNINTKKNNKKSIVKKRNITKKTVIDEIFPPFRFFLDLIELAERSKKFMSKDDLIRLDLIYITTLFYNEKNIDYYFYTKLCFLLIKYQNNSQVLTPLILIFELMHNENVFSSQKYEILKKNEELRKSLEVYLKKYGDFILYSDKSPINYYYISKKYKKFKDLLKTIHIYFKKNIECNYELILNRYIYELLVHQKYKNMESFDLNNYADFIEYHYNNNRSFMIRNIINQDAFIILKGAREILKYKNERLEVLFPSEFQNDAINKFKTKLNDLDKNETNPLFEYVINSFVNSTSQFGFVDSFKMRYTIYPTHLINEIYILVNYIIGYNNIIIFEKNEYGSDVLYSFSPKLYKYFGICPSDICLLKKTGIDICFNDLFTKSHKNKNNQEEEGKHIYIFKYETYSILLKHLLTYDILKDSPNYKQILDKKNEFETMGKSKNEVQFQLTKKWEYKTNNNKLYKFFSIKENRKKADVTISKYNSHISKNFHGLDMGIEEDNNSDEDEFEYLKEDEFKGKGMTMVGSTLSSTSLTRSFESGDSKQKGKKDEKLDEKIKKQQQLNRYTYILLCYSIVLIIITIIFLILETSQNNHFRKVINLFITFREFKRGIERYPLTILSNFQIYYKNNTSVNLYERYSKSLGEKSEILNHYVCDILIQELISKLDIVIDRFNKFQRGINNLGSTLAKRLNSLTGYKYEIYVEDDTIWCRATNVTLIILFRSYINIITKLLKDSAYYGVEFPLINFIGENEKNNIIETVESYDAEVTTILKNMFLLSFSYPYTHSGLVNSASVFISVNREIIDLITKILITFFIILTILHIILGFISILFIISFTNVLILNISDTNKLFEDKKFLEFHQRRLEQIKIMKNLYSENPLKIADKISVVEDFYKRNKNEEIKGISNKNFVSNLSTNSLSDKKQKDNESVKDDKSEISKKNEKNYYRQQNIKTFNPISESLIGDNENKNNDKKTKNADFKDMEFNEEKFEDVISSKSIKLTQKQFLPILRIQYMLIYISFGFYFIYTIILFILVFTLGVQKLKHLVDYSNYNDLIDGYLYDNANALLFLMQTNSTSVYYGNIDNPGKNIDYIENGINLLYEAIIGKEDIENIKGGFFSPISKLLNLNCSEVILTDGDFVKMAAKMGFDYDIYFKELCKFFPAAQSGSDTVLFHEILYLVEILYRKFSTSQNFETLFVEYLNQTELYDLFTLILIFNRIQRNYFNLYNFREEVNGVLNYFALLMYIYLIISVILEISIFLIVYFGIIVQVKEKDNLIVSFSDSLKHD